MRHVLALGALIALAPSMDAFAQQQAAVEQAAAAPETAAAEPAATDDPAADQPAVESTPNQRTLNTRRACHTFEEGQRALIGPNLHGLFGRRAASTEGFRYSANMRALGATGHVWSEQTLRLYLTDPRAVVPQTAMRFPASQASGTPRSSSRSSRKRRAAEHGAGPQDTGGGLDALGRRRALRRPVQAGAAQVGAAVPRF